MTERTCPCGSGKHRMAQYDARGIFLCFTCEQCHQKRMGMFRPDVLTDSNYWANEPIDEE